MAEKIENIKKINNLLSKEVATLSEEVKSSAKSVKSLKAKLDEMMKTITAKKAEMAKIEAEKAQEKQPVVETKVVVEEKAEVKEEIKEEKVVSPTVKEETAKPITETKAKEERKEEKVEEKVEVKKEYDTSSWLVRKADKTEEKKPSREYHEKTFDKKPRKEYVAGENKDRVNNGGKPNFAQKPQQNGQKSFNNRQSSATTVAVAPATIPVATKDNKNFKKKTDDKKYEEKKVVNKRALVKKNVSIDDFDEDKTGYRKVRPAKKQKQQENTQAIKIESAVITTEIIPLKVLSEKIGVSAIEITKRLFKEGIMKTINDSIDYDTAEYIAADLGVTLTLKLEKTAEDKLSEGFDEADDETKMVKRPPVVTVMGHVDHGKTSLLDRIRKTNVTAGEAGGITQHIGAYQVQVSGKPITFLDTPGHAAFTAMRARGAQATDIAVLVVAADDGIMPQTIEAINHAKAADVNIIVAINKIDKPEANIDRIKTQLTEQGLVPEEWGGDTMICPVSAKAGTGVDDLLEAIILLAELKELKANPDRKAKGVVIEAKLDNSKGPIANVLIQAGTLKVGDPVVIGTVTGKIRAMIDDKGRRIATAGPSTPVSIMGLDEVPNAGDIMYAVTQELTKQVAEERRNKAKELELAQSAKVTLDDVFNKIAEGEMKTLNLIVKADVQGSVEAVKQSLTKLSNEEVRVSVIHSGVGAISETDIMLAESSKAIIIGFNVRPDSNAKNSAEKSGVDIKLYRVIYEAIDDVEKALKGMLAPKFQEIYLGKAEVRNTFKITGVGMVAGCYVTEGKISRNGKLRIYRDDVMICEGNVLQLKRFKDDVKEVQQGFECGISIEKFNDIKIGDFIECYLTEQIQG